MVIVYGERERVGKVVELVREGLVLSITPICSINLFNSIWLRAFIGTIPSSSILRSLSG